MAETLFATAGTAELNDAGLGIVWFERHTADGFALRVIDYRLYEMSEVDAELISAIYARSRELVDEHKPATAGCKIIVEHLGLLDVLKRADAAYRESGGKTGPFGIERVSRSQSEKWPKALDERVSMTRPHVDSGRVIKLETGLRRFIFRANSTNHLVAQLKRYSPGDAASAGELFHAFVLGVLIGTSREPSSWFAQTPGSSGAAITAPSPFGAYIPGGRPL